MKNILILGSGLVSRPGVRYLLKQKNIFITVASNELNKAEELISGYPNARAIEVKADNDNELSIIIKDNDIVVSLLPWFFHLKVAKLCLDYGKHMLTASYVSDEMKKLDDQVRQKKLVFLNELGVDPGIDHMSAMSIIDKVHSEGGKVLHFYSYCGGLPAPENNDNPFGYKFSWSPRGVVLASRNSAKFLEDGKIVNIDGKDLFLNYQIEDIEGIGKLEVYPNRDSTPYKELYGLKDALTVKRGTYRYPGWCDTFKKIVDLGLIDETPRDNLKGITFRKMMSDIVGCDPNDNIILNVAEKINLPYNHAIIQKLTWLGLFSDENVSPNNNYLDVLCDLLQKKLVYKEGEKDMLVLRHKFIVENKDKSRDMITSTLIDFGIPFGDTAMARTVSLPMAIGTKLIAEEKIQSRGVIIPTLKEIYEPILNELSSLNVRMKEKRWRIEEIF